MGIKTFATGATRSDDADGVRFDLINYIGLRRLAETCAEGAAKYGENKWRLGIPKSDLLNHAIRHIYLHLDGDESEDHLAHAAWNLFTAMYFEERGNGGEQATAAREPKEHRNGTSVSPEAGSGYESRNDHRTSP